jgi:hypothetical protein
VSRMDELSVSLVLAIRYPCVNPGSNPHLLRRVSREPRVTAAAGTDNLRIVVTVTAAE